MIKPTNGRIVWFTPGRYDEELYPVWVKYGPTPWAAQVCWVWGDQCVNLLVTAPDGSAWKRTSVFLRQDGDAIIDGQQYAEWMPYQVGQAKKHEAEK
jgi:hypothetical protein